MRRPYRSIPFPAPDSFPAATESIEGDRSMFGGNQATDKALLKTVTQRLARGTGAQTRTTATVQGGAVTLTGTLRYEAQRIPIIKEVARIQGVRRVLDQLKVLPKAVYPTGPIQPSVEPNVDEGTLGSAAERSKESAAEED
jgi:hypothetical protein